MHAKLTLYADDGTTLVDTRFVPAGPIVINLVDGQRVGGHMLVQLVISPVFSHETLEIARLADGTSVTHIEAINTAPEPRGE